jgi:hypothetical protein
MVKIKTSKVSVAFEMLLREFNNEIETIEKKVQKSFKIDKFISLREELKYAEQLSSFRKKVASLLRKWNDLFPRRGSRRGKGGGKKSFPKQLLRGVKTPSKAYYRPILKALIELGGKASVNKVLIRVEKPMKSTLKEVDYQPIPSNPNEPRWVNTAKWACKDMTIMKPPLLRPDSPKKVWEITEAGRRFLEEGDH